MKVLSGIIMLAFGTETIIYAVMRYPDPLSTLADTSIIAISMGGLLIGLGLWVLGEVFK